MTIRTPPPTRPPQSMGDHGWWNQMLGSLYHLWQRLNRTQLDIGEATIYTGTGSPEGSQEGSVGDLFLRRDGGSGSTFYVKESGDGTDSGWAAK